MRVIKKCFYGKGHDRQYSSIYLPNTNREDLAFWPILIWFHQGTYKEGGDRSEVLEIVNRFVPAGYIVIAAEYWCPKTIPITWNDRLTAMNRAVRDMARVIDSVYYYTDALGGDPQYIFVGSESWGAMYLNFLILADAGDTGPCLQGIRFTTPIIGLISYWGGCPGQDGILIANSKGTGYSYAQGREPPDILLMTNKYDSTIDTKASVYVELTYVDAGKVPNINMWAYQVSFPPLNPGDPWGDAHRLWNESTARALGRMFNWTEAKLATYPGIMQQQLPAHFVPAWPP